MLPTITVDVGTTSVKLCLFDAAGVLRADARTATPTIADPWGEIYDVDALTAAVSGFVGGLRPEDRAMVQRISFTGVGESGGLVRGDMSLASPMILWHDHRGAPFLQTLDEEARGQIYRQAGLPVNANYGLSKIVWALEHATDAADAQWLNIAEFLAGTLAGRRWSEYSLASRTSALDLRTGTWSAELAGLVGVDVAAFPPLRPAAHGHPITAAAALQLQVSADVMVHVAGHDHMVGAVGADLRPGEMLNSTGTTEGLLFLREQPSLGPSSETAKLANGISCTADSYTLFASIPTGGSAFATMTGLLGVGSAELAHITERVYAQYVAGTLTLSTAPIVLPRFRGSPPPTKRHSDRGAVANLRTDTTRDELVLGVFAGMVLQFRDVLDLFPDAASRVKVIGPASRNPLWMQLKADLLGTTLSVSSFPEVVSRGAQALASGRVMTWAASDPHDITADPARHDRLTDWAGEVHPVWEHLKGIPS